MKTFSFKQDRFILPVTPAGFEKLVNEFIKPMNKLMKPNFIDGDTMAQVLMGVIHALDRTNMFYSKKVIFASCVNSISKQVTYGCGMSAKLRAEKKAQDEATKLQAETEKLQAKVSKGKRKTNVATVTKLIPSDH